ncbi:hypothetical protein DFJ73DRAFT_832874 [Zopfochytrium polystomum]|nr:hypothetical protein DFJ73DRAFT_832874 [Zopfochytrium polystomum]
MAARASPPAVSPTTASAAAAAGVAHPLKGSPQGLSVDSLVGAGAEGSDSPGFSDEVFDNTNLSEILGASTTEELDAKELGRLQRGGGHALVAPRPAAKRLTLGPARRTTVYAAPPPLSAAARQQAMQSYHAEMDRLQKRTSIYAGPMRVPVKMPTRDETGRAFQELSFNASLNSENLTRTVGKAMLPQKADTETKMVHPLSQQAGFGAPAGLPKPNMTAMIPSRMAAPSAAPASPMAPRRVPNPLASVQAAAVLVPLPATPQRVPNILSTPLRVIQQDTARLIGMAVMDVSAPGSARLKALGQREADVSSPFLKRSERVEAPMRPQNRFLSMLRSEVASDDADQNEEVGRPTNGHTGQKLPHMETTLDSPLSLSDLTLASVDRSAEPKHCAPRQQLLPDPFELLGLTDPIGDVEKEGPTDARTANGPDDDAIIQLIGDRNMHLVQVPQGFGHVDVVDEAQLSSELDAMKAEEESLLREIQKLGHFEDA